MLDGLAELATYLPGRLSPGHSLHARRVLEAFLARFATNLGVAHDSNITAGFLVFARSTHSLDAWHQEWSALLLRFNTVASTLHSKVPRPALLPSVQAALDLLEARHTDPQLQVADIAAVMGLSRSHASRVLKAQTGITFAQQLRRIRVRSAERMLRHSSLSMKEIAVAAGFGSANNFGRQFRQIHGVSPTAFRGALVT